MSLPVTVSGAVANRFPAFFAHGNRVNARSLDRGMGTAVARRTVFRKLDQEDMGNVADRVAEGNLAMVGLGRDSQEFAALRNAIATGSLITSGRHLQHGDAGQPNRSMELHTNCSSASLSFPLFKLLLSGSGVGRSYDDGMMVVDWGKAPNLKIVLDEGHRDYPHTTEQLYDFAKSFSRLPWDIEVPANNDGEMMKRPYTFEDFAGDDGAIADVVAFRDKVMMNAVPRRVLEEIPVAKRGYAFWETAANDNQNGAVVWNKPSEISEEGIEVRVGKTVYYRVPDTREGWAKAMELYESLAFEGRSDLTLILDFSDVRPLGAPIGGMQDRPASGPVSLMRAFHNVAVDVVKSARDNGMDLWEQAMRVDHHLSVEVQVGGARRAARMSTKSWRDKGVLEFVAIKSQGGLWTSNNSIMVDAEFWERVREAKAAIENLKSGINTALTSKEAIDATKLEELGEKVSGMDPLTLHAWKVFVSATANAYINGEPGFINGDKLESMKTGIARQRPIVTDGSDFGSKRYQATWSKQLLATVSERALSVNFPMIVNPCVAADQWVLTSEGPRQVSDLIDVPYTAVVDGKEYDATAFWKTGEKELLRIKTDRGYEIRVTDNHKVKVERDRRWSFRRVDGKLERDEVKKTFEWVEAGDLKIGDRLVIGDNRAAKLDISAPEFDRGWLVGEIIGDGGYNSSNYNAYLRFWGENAQEMADLAYEIAKDLPRDYHAPSAATGAFRSNDTWMIQGKMLSDLVSGLIEDKTKTPLAELEKQSLSFQAGVVRGLFDADGSVQGGVSKGRSIRLAQSNLETLKTVQRILVRLGIASTIYENRKDAGYKNLPDGKGGLREYPVKACHELVITRENMVRFADVIGFYDTLKAEAMHMMLVLNARGEYTESWTAEITSIETDGVEAVYDCTVNDVHAFDCNGLIVHNCGEIELHVLGAYCVIADAAPLLACPFDFTLYQAGFATDEMYAEWDARFEESVRLAARFCMRVNLMDSLYHREVARTNRIGVSLTGIHEYAWSRFGLAWSDLLDEEKSADFWSMLARMSDAVKDEAEGYAKELGVEVPHTSTTIKPAGSTSKLYGLSEGAHLPARRQYLRWVQFRGMKANSVGWRKDADPLLQSYEEKGYRVRGLQSFPGMSIVGFPTVPLIVQLGLADKLVTAPEATPEDQFRYLQLLEENWIGADQGNQVSYTMKIYTDQHSVEDFQNLLLEYQPTIRCCSIMPSKPDHEMGYEYLPEEEVDMDAFADIVANINDPELRQDIDMHSLQCASGACPI